MAQDILTYTTEVTRDVH